MAKDYIPRATGQFNIFQQNLVKAVVANASGWAIPTAEVTALSAALVEYAKRYKPVSDKLNCTTAQRTAHQVFRATYEKQIRKFVNRYVRDNPNISQSDLVGMNIPVKGKKRGSRSAITDSISFHIVAMDGCRAKFHCRIPNHDGDASIHPEADAVEIRYVIGNIPANYKDCPNVVTGKKAQVILTLEPGMQGQHVYAFARWVNLSNNSLSGPYSVMAKVMLH